MSMKYDEICNFAKSNGGFVARLDHEGGLLVVPYNMITVTMCFTDYIHTMRWGFIGDKQNAAGYKASLDRSCESYPEMNSLVAQGARAVFENQCEE